MAGVDVPPSPPPSPPSTRGRGWLVARNEAIRKLIGFGVIHIDTNAGCSVPLADACCHAPQLGLPGGPGGKGVKTARNEAIRNLDRARYTLIQSSSWRHDGWA